MLFRILLWTSLIFSSGQSLAQQLDREAMSLIRETVEGICGEIIVKGSNQVLSVEGTGVAELKGLAKKLANLGLDAGIKFENEEYVGPLREELANERIDTRTCRLKVFERLLATLDVAVAPETATASNEDFVSLEVISENCSVPDELVPNMSKPRDGRWQLVFDHSYIASDGDLYTGIKRGEDYEDLGHGEYFTDPDLIGEVSLDKYERKYPSVTVTCKFGRCLNYTIGGAPDSEITLLFETTGCQSAFYENIKNKIE